MLRRIPRNRGDRRSYVSIQEQDRIPLPEDATDDFDEVEDWMIGSGQSAARKRK